jgi:hypothetical protein
MKASLGPLLQQMAKTIGLIADRKMATPPMRGTGRSCTARVPGRSIAPIRLANRITAGVVKRAKTSEPRYMPVYVLILS